MWGKKEQLILWITAYIPLILIMIFRFIDSNDFFKKTKNFDANNTTIEHNKIYETYDGEYQLDGYIEHTALNVKYKTLVECKLHKNSIKRDFVVLLKDKVQSTGSQKGILISTSGFQSGAVKYAKQHGIALFQIIDGSIMRIQASLSPNKTFRQEPKHTILMYDLDMNFPAYQIDKDSKPLENFLNNTVMKNNT